MKTTLRRGLETESINHQTSYAVSIRTSVLPATRFQVTDERVVSFPYEDLTSPGLLLNFVLEVIEAALESRDAVRERAHFTQH